MQESNVTTNARTMIAEETGTRAANAMQARTDRAGSPEALPERVLGRTGVRVPVFGCGGGPVIGGAASFFGHAEQSHEERVRLIRNAYDAGLRYFDNARGYQDSEEIFGEALHDVRNGIFLATKVGAVNASEARASVEASLKALRTDYVDCLQLHDTANEHGYDATLRLFEEVARMRDEGLCRFIGLTGHAKHRIMHSLLSLNIFDTLLIDYCYFAKNVMSRHSRDSIAWRNRCIAKANELGVGIIAMKILGANVFSHRARELNPGRDDAYYNALARAALRWAYADSRFHVFTVGVGQAGDIIDNIVTFRDFGGFSEADRALLEDHLAVYRNTEFYRQLSLV